MRENYALKRRSVQTHHELEALDNGTQESTRVTFQFYVFSSRTYRARQRLRVMTKVKRYPHRQGVTRESAVED